MLRTDLSAGGEIRILIERYEIHKASILYQALVDAVLRANWKEVEEEKGMCKALEELFAKELEEARSIGLESGRTEALVPALLFMQPVIAAFL